MSWMFQSNDPEKRQLKELIDDYPFGDESADLDKFKQDVIAISKPVNVNHEKLAQLLGMLVSANNKSRARKLIDASVAKERLADGPKRFFKILFFPLLFAVGMVVIVFRGPYRWGKRMIDAL